MNNNNSSGTRPPRYQSNRTMAGSTGRNNGNALANSGEGTTTTTTASDSDKNSSSSRASFTLVPLPPLPSHLRGNSASERSRLLASSSTTQQRQSRNTQSRHPFRRQSSSSFFSPRCCSVSCVSAAGAVIMSLAIFIGVYMASHDDSTDTLIDQWLFPRKHRVKPYYEFPDNFTWGVATSSYQIEGAVHQGGRGECIWDAFCQEPRVIADGSDGSIACDHYHKVEQDVALMASLNIRAYRFSIAWPRILPAGTGPVNPSGLAFYNHLIDTLLRYEIEPWVTLFHWDLPQALMQNGNEGWLHANTSYAFAEYASICFQAFGDRVNHWITLNEAWTVAVNGYATGIHAPGHQSTTEPYIVGHNLLLAHGLAVQAFRDYQNRTLASATNSSDSSSSSRSAMIGIANCGDFRYPTEVADNATAARVMLFPMGWFTDPLFFGDYPKVMRERLGTRLPVFTPEQRQLLVGSVDFVGLNYYSSLQASTPMTPPVYPGYWTTDIDAILHPHPDWRLNDMGWAVVPDGLRNMLVWISERYHYPLVYITENGDAEHRDVVKPLMDTNRQDYLMGHVRAAGQALERGVKLGGYFAWTLMDNFEWQFGYTKKFGLVKVDFADGSLRRTPKGSAYWYNRTIAAQGKNIPRAPPLSWFPSV